MVLIRRVIELRMKALCVRQKNQKRRSTRSTTTHRVETPSSRKACHFPAGVEQFSVYPCPVLLERVYLEAIPAITGAQSLTFMNFQTRRAEGSTAETPCSVSDKPSRGSLMNFQGSTASGITQKLP